jgi:DNA recombination-mediator protein A
MDDTTIFSDKERLARLRLIRAANIGGVTFWALLDRYGDAQSATAALPELIRKSRGGRPIRLATEREAEHELEQAERSGAELLMHGEPNYPRSLAELEVPPPIVTVRGNPKHFARDTIAIVGARNASALGQRFARDIARDLGAAGIVIASGLARGIDTAAHKGSLATGTIAVMAGGIDVVYPSAARRDRHTRCGHLRTADGPAADSTTLSTPQPHHLRPRARRDRGGGDVELRFADHCANSRRTRPRRVRRPGLAARPARERNQRSAPPRRNPNRERGGRFERPRSPPASPKTEAEIRPSGPRNPSKHGRSPARNPKAFRTRPG